MDKLSRDKEGPIGVFDSGVGGLSVLRTLENRLPAENYIYFGDTARVPYGSRRFEEVRSFTVEIGNWLLARGCKMIIIACNMATVLGMPDLAASAPVPVFGMAEAALTEALEDLDGKGEDIWPMGLVAAAGTVASGGYQRAFAERAPGKPFYIQSCPEFVTFVEQGILEGADVDRAVEKYLSPLRERNIRSLVLGCTHFPFLHQRIAAFLGDGVRLVDPAGRLALAVENTLREKGGLSGAARARGERLFFCSGDTGEFRDVGQRLLGRFLDSVGRQAF